MKKRVIKAGSFSIKKHIYGRRLEEKELKMEFPMEAIFWCDGDGSFVTENRDKRTIKGETRGDGFQKG